MANPKDWFRRRRSPSAEDGWPERNDPFSEDTVLDLGQSATMLRETADERSHAVSERRGAVPPPSAPPKREPTTIDRTTFAARPALVRNGEPTTRPPSAPPPSRAGASPFTIRRAPTVQLASGSPRPNGAAPRPAAPAPRLGPEGGRREEGENAAFHLAAPGAAWRRGTQSVGEAGQISALLRDAFTPTRPKQNATLFSGRFKQMQRIIAAIEEERAHVVVYGERGSGKTSLANVLSLKAEEAGYLVQRFACSSELSFDDIFRSLLRRLPASLLADGIGATSRAGIDNFEQLLPGHCGVAELIPLFERISEKHVIFIIDEYDRITSEDTKAHFAELIKNMSDAAAPVTLLIIGVAENVRDLLGKHPSLQRTLVTVPMPLMSRREIDGILVSGEEKCGLRFEPWVRQTIGEFAQGLPYHAQLLGLFSARSAVRRRSMAIEREDLRYAVQRAAEEAEARTKEAYNLALGAPETSSFRDVLYYAARCKSDEFGSFAAADVAAAAAAGRSDVDAGDVGEDAQAQSLLALQYPLKKLTEPARGAMLRRIIGPSGLRYQFQSQMLRHYVLVRQAEQRGLV